jgi:tripartite-type tricarboxylate transporter receptor subunit TctC
MRILILFSSILIALGSAAHGQSAYPARTIQVVVGFPPGAAPDVAARILANKLAERLRVAVVVENATGAAGNTATAKVARAEPDGYTLLMAGSAAIVINPSLYEHLSFDPQTDLVPITEVCYTPNILVVPADLPVQTVADLIRYIQANPRKLSYGSAGIGTSQHLAGELLKKSAKLDITHVPYRGGPAAIKDLIGGQILMEFANINDALPLVREHKLKALAVTSPHRSPFAPDVPTMQEQGFSEFDIVVWFGLMAPSGTPREVIDLIHREVVSALADPQVKSTLGNLGITPLGSTPAEFADTIMSEGPRWKALIESSGARAR